MDSKVSAAPSVAPEGFVCVPVEPTQAMLEAMANAAGMWCEPSDDVKEDGVVVEFGMSEEDAARINADTCEGLRDQYKAALAAAPAASPVAGKEE